MRITRFFHAALILLIGSAFLVAPSVEAFQKVSNTRRINLTLGKSVVINTTTDVSRVSVGNTDIADVQVLSPKEVYIVGKRPGTTNLTMWQEEEGGNAAVLDIAVSIDVTELKLKLHQILPEETGIKVIATNNRITLSGTVRNAAALSEAIALAETYLGENGQVNNLLTVAGGQQVMLEVKIAEMSKSLMKRLGVNFSWTNAGEFGIGTMGGLVDIVQPTAAEMLLGPVGVVTSPQVNGLLRFNSGSATWTGFFDVLKSNGAVKILAEPTLIALSGQDASFLAGGEYPVPVPAGDGDVAIEYKPYGVYLKFTPIVLGDDRISIKVKPEVSEIDYSVATIIAGATVPGVTTRKAETLVELADGQSFAIAGLLRDTSRETAQKNPVLGDMPIIGALFKSKSFQRNETELIIIVTPHLARPLDMAHQTLPTDYYTEPDDAEFFLWGIFGKSRKEERVRLDGRFGHIVE